MPTTSIIFNSKAVEFISKSKPTKVRIDATWKASEGLRLRPTNRKNGPHMLVPLVARAKTMVMELDDATLGKLVEEGMPSSFLQAGERYTVIDDTYGWLVLLGGEDHETNVGKATVSVKK